MARSASQGIGSGRLSTVLLAFGLFLMLVAISSEAAHMPAASARNEHRMILNTRRLQQLVSSMGSSSKFGVLSGGSGGSKFGASSIGAAGGGEGGSAGAGGSSGLTGTADSPQPAAAATGLRTVNTGGTVGGRR